MAKSILFVLIIALSFRVAASSLKENNFARVFFSVLEFCGYAGEFIGIQIGRHGDSEILALGCDYEVVVGHEFDGV